MAEKKFIPRKAHVICASYQPSLRARKLFDDQTDARTLFLRLLKLELYKDAVQFLAYSLTPRSAVWWGCLSARHIGGEPLPPVEESALDAAVTWVVRQTEESRKQAGEAGKAAGLRTAAGAIALAASWSGKTPDEIPDEVPKLCFKAVAGGIILAAFQRDPREGKNNLKRLLALGLGVFQRHITWHRD